MILVFYLCPNGLRESKKVLDRKFIMPITDYSTYIIHMYILYSKESGKVYFGLTQFNVIRFAQNHGHILARVLTFCTTY